MIDLSSMVTAEKINEALAGFIPKLIVALMILGIFWLIQRLTCPAIRGVLRRARIDEGLVKLLADRLYAPALMLIGVVTAIGHLGVNVTAALAGISVMGIAVGLAAQDSFANMIAGFLIFWDKPFSVGHFITVQDQYGQVMEITLRSTRIRTQRNTYVVIPNRNLIDSVLVNHTMYGETRIEVPIGIAYKESIPEARRVLLAAVRAIEGVLESPEPDVVANETASSSVDLIVRVWIDDAAIERQTFYSTLEACKLALDEAGIQIPYPHLQLFVDNVEDRVWQKAAHLAVAGRSGGAGN